MQGLKADITQGEEANEKYCVECPHHPVELLQTLLYSGTEQTVRGVLGIFSILVLEQGCCLGQHTDFKVLVHIKRASIC
jgi:hypothetical protein